MENNIQLSCVNAFTVHTFDFNKSFINYCFCNRILLEDRMIQMFKNSVRIFLDNEIYFAVKAHHVLKSSYFLTKFSSQEG